jgi:hypothetical protein
MAMEWMKADVLRVMEEQSNNGVVQMSTVRERFNLTRGAKVAHFDQCLADLQHEGRVIWISTHMCRLTHTGESNG